MSDSVAGGGKDRMFVSIFVLALTLVAFYWRATGGGGH